MTVIRKKLCDRCGVEAQDEKGWEEILLAYRTPDPPHAVFDLCPKCTARIRLHFSELKTGVMEMLAALVKPLPVSEAQMNAFREDMKTVK